jgi:hypothetical protein
MSAEDRSTAVPVIKADAQLPGEHEADLHYVRATFVALADGRRALVGAAILPQATYALPDGTPMVPADHGQLLEDAGGDPRAVGALFRARFLGAGGRQDDVEQAHADWLSGDFGACLWSTTPEMIVLKSSLTGAIEALLAHPESGTPGWDGALRNAVDALDAIERPFADYDRVRWDPPLSRDRLITAMKARYPELWGTL